MKIVVIGGTGLIGRALVSILKERGHDAVAASPASGVNAVTGEGLDAALQGAQVVVDVANSPSFADDDVMAFFDKSTRNLLAAEAKAGVKHHVALSVVGTERLLASGYFLAKMKQEELIEAGSIPYTIVRATQFFEFIAAIGQFSVVGDEIRLSPAMMQPIAAADVSAALADVAVAAPLNGMSEVAGPDKIRMNEIVGMALSAAGDKRPIVADPKALYWGAELNDASLTPGANPRLGPTHFADWLKK
jgi:uncharacterized protein YbjT (DUF2867 family)